MAEKIKLHIDTISYKDKKSVKENANKIKYRVQYSKPVEVSIDELIEAIQHGKTISPAVMKGTKSNDFLEQQLFAIDIDNENKNIPILQIQDAINICNSNNCPVAFYYPSFSHTEELPKYRLVFILDKIVTNKNIRDTIMNNLCSLFGQADLSCVNADRLFFGTNKEVKKVDTENLLKTEIALGLFPPKIENRYDKKSFDTELEKLKNEFDFFDYLLKRNGPIITDNGKYTMFENCEICGHHKDLVYYKDSNTFHCFGANGNIGGSIIDYLMKVKNLNLKQAIDKFKYELCSIEKVTATIKTINAKELLSMDLEEPYVIVENMLCQGFTILAGPPKIGKSWLCLDLCISICTGQPFLEFKTNKNDCLYLALEDSYPRLKKRIKKILGTKNIPDNFHLAISSMPLNEGLLEALQEQLVLHPNVKLIIIDTLQKVRGNQGKTESTYQYDYKEIGKLKSFADENKMCILAIHHLRKGKDRSDVFNQISGSTGLTGAADTSIVLDRTDNTNLQALLSITGRDVEMTEILLRFDKITFKWEVVGDGIDFYKQVDKVVYETNPIVITIKKLLEEKPEGLKITASNLLKKIFEITGSYPKQDKPNSLTREINSNLQFQLLEFDGIHYDPPNKNGGNKGRNLFFSKPIKNTDILK